MTVTENRWQKVTWDFLNKAREETQSAPKEPVSKQPAQVGFTGSKSDDFCVLYGGVV